MTKRRILIFCIFLFVCFAHISMYSKTVEVVGDFETVQCDNVGFIYATKNNNIYKYNDEGKLLYVFNYNRYGARPSIDVSTPMRVFLYFADFKKIIILDSRLAEIRSIDANLFTDIENPTLACYSKDQNIWMYNATRFTLMKIDNIGNRVYESQSLSILTDDYFLPIRIREQENNVFLTDTTRGILMFDILGTYLKTIPLKSIEYFQIKEGKIFFYFDNRFQSIDLSSFELKTYNVNEDPLVRRILLSNGNLVKLGKEKFTISPLYD